MNKKSLHTKLVEYAQTARDFNSHNGMRVVELDGESVTVEVELTQDSLNPQGCAHGGLLFSLCDFATGLLAFAGGRGGVTLDASMHYLRPGLGGTLHCVSERIREGRTTGLYEARVYDEEDTLLSKGEFTYYFTDRFSGSDGRKPILNSGEEQ